MNYLIRLLVCWALGVLTVASPVFGDKNGDRNVRVVSLQNGGSYLGVGVEDVNKESMGPLKLKEERGVEIKYVEEDSPAARAGLKVGDVVLEYNKQAVEGTQQFIRMVKETPAGRKVPLSVWRNGSAQIFSAQIEVRKGTTESMNWPSYMPEVMPFPQGHPMALLKDMPHPSISWQNMSIGIETEALNSQLADFFGVKAGVLVKSVSKQSAAEKAGMKAGDVIVKVNGEAIKAPEQVSAAARASAASKKTVSLTVVRNHKEISVDLKLDEMSNQWFLSEDNEDL